MRVRIGFGALVGSIVLAIATTAHTVAGGAGANGRIAFDRADRRARATRSSTPPTPTPAHGKNVYTANADGTGLTPVTSDGADDDPAWGTHPPVHQPHHVAATEME